MRTKDFFITVGVFFYSLLNYAVDPPPDLGDGSGPPPPKGLPIDDNIYILLGFAILLAGYYLITYKNKKTQSEI